MKQKVEILKSTEVLGKELNVYGSIQEPLFLAKDVATWIGHKDVSMMLKNIEEDERVSLTNPNNACGGQNRNVTRNLNKRMSNI